MQVVIFVEHYVIYGMVKHFHGASLDSLLEMDRDEFLEIKNIIRNVSFTEARNLAQSVLEKETIEEVKKWEGVMDILNLPALRTFKIKVDFRV